MSGAPERRAAPTAPNAPAAWQGTALRWACVAAPVLAYLLVPDVRATVDQWVFVLAMVDVYAVRGYVQAAGAWAQLVSIGMMVLQAVLAPLPAFVVTFANAALFGWAWGAALSWTGAMLGAALCFGLARWLGRGLVERVVPAGALRQFDALTARWGLWAVLVARLLPVVPFDPVSYAAGLARIKGWRFMLATGAGQLPATIVYSLAGDLLAVNMRWLAGGIAVVFVGGAALAWLDARRRKGPVP